MSLAVFSFPTQGETTKIIGGDHQTVGHTCENLRLEYAVELLGPGSIVRNPSLSFPCL